MTDTPHPPTAPDTPTPAQRRFLLLGVGLAAGLLTAALWLGSLRHAYSHFSSNVHETCGTSVSLRAEGYNLLGGTRYGTEPGDTGYDVELAQIDICDPVLQVLPNGEERLWFWLDVHSTGKTFPYYAWNVPERDIQNPNANEWRDPVDPLWGAFAFTVTNYVTDEVYWSTTRGEICPPIAGEVPGVALFVDSTFNFRIPEGQRRSAWMCVRMGPGQPLPDTLMLTIRPQLARLTRWVDRIFPIKGESRDADEVLRRGYQLPVLHTNEDICYHALDTHPDSILPDGGCPYSAE
jgi:hypothetical protein